MKKFITSHKIYLLFSISVLALIMSGCGVVKSVPTQTAIESPCYKDGPAIICPPTPAIEQETKITLPVAVSSTFSTATSTSAVKGWKVHVDEEYNFVFSYPPNLVINGRSDMNTLLLDDKYGHHIINIDAGSVPIFNNFEEGIKLSNRYDLDKQKAVNLLLEKISDTTTTVGYLSRWKFYSLGTLAPWEKAIGFENAAIFGSKLGVASPSSNGEENKFIVTFQTYDLQNWSPISVDLFRQIVSTFQFTQ